jgi:hypothetical protein
MERRAAYPRPDGGVLTFGKAEQRPERDRRLADGRGLDNTHTAHISDEG